MGTPERIPALEAGDEVRVRRLRGARFTVRSIRLEGGRPVAEVWGGRTGHEMFRTFPVEDLVRVRPRKR